MRQPMRSASGTFCGMARIDRARAHRLARRAHGLEPEPDQRADPLADLHRSRSRSGVKCAASPRRPPRSTPRSCAAGVLGQGEPRLGRIDAKLGRRAVHRLVRPAVEHRMLADLEGEAEAEGFEGSWVGHDALIGRAAPRSRNLTSTSAMTIVAAPVQSSGVKRLAIIEPAEQRRERRLGEHGDARRPAAGHGRAHRPAGPGRRPGCTAPARTGRSSRRG